MIMIVYINKLCFLLPLFCLLLHVCCCSQLCVIFPLAPKTWMTASVVFVGIFKAEVSFEIEVKILFKDDEVEIVESMHISMFGCVRCEMWVI